MLLALHIHCYKAMAKDFGTRGEVFVIEEEDMLEFIKMRLQKIEKEGILAQKQHEMKQRLEGYVNRPTPVDGVSHTIKPRIWAYDPSYVLKEDIRDQDRKSIHKAGTVINPLDKVAMPYELLFIDADDKSQVAWALNYPKSNEKPCRVILVKGAPLKLMKQYSTRVYFDQKGILINRFAITQVPAIVRQHGNKLLIEELQLKEQ